MGKKSSIQKPLAHFGLYGSFNIALGDVVGSIWGRLSPSTAPSFTGAPYVLGCAAPLLIGLIKERSAQSCNKMVYDNENAEYYSFRNMGMLSALLAGALTLATLEMTDTWSPDLTNNATLATMLAVHPFAEAALGGLLGHVSHRLLKLTHTNDAQNPLLDVEQSNEGDNQAGTNQQVDERVSHSPSVLA